MKRKIIGFQSLDESLTKLFRMMRIVLLVMCVITVSSVVTQAQNKALSGTVTDANRLPLPGVTVLVKGTTIGTITDGEGKFTLSVPAGSKTLVFSFVGMTKSEVAIGNQTNYSVSLKEESVGLGEVVVVGFGTQKKESVVGSIVTTNAETLARSGSPANLATALTGQLAGVTTIASSGEPGNDDPRILIRAQGTWNNSQPLILVDGIERKMNDIDISEVENISVLKDASATAVFGVKGSEGVILITTKRGRVGKPKLTVEANVTLKQVSKTPEKLDSYDSFLMANSAIEHELPNTTTNWSRIKPMAFVNMYRNSPGYNRNSYIPDANGGNTPYRYNEVFPDVNWPKEMVKPFALSNRLNLNVSGGTDFTKYFASFAYLHDADVLKSGMDVGRPYKSEWAYDRFNFRSNLDFSITKTTTLSVNLSGYVGIKMESFNANANGNFWDALYNTSPDAFIPRWPDGYWGTTAPGVNIVNSVQAINNYGVEKKIRTQISSDFLLKQNLDFITKGLSATASLSFDTRFNTTGGIFDRVDGAYTRYVDPNIIYMKKGQSFMDYTYGSNRAPGLLNFDYVPQPIGWLAESSGGSSGSYNGLDYYGVAIDAPYRRLYYQAKVDYARKFGKHDIAVTGVFDRQQLATGSEFPHLREDWIGRVTYNYDGRYFFETNGAYNGSEQFGPKYRFGFFPSFGLGWMLSNEKWLKREWLDKLKLRYSLGKVADDNIGNGRWLYQDQWATGDKINTGVTTGSSPYTQYYQSTIGNPNIHWEVSQKQNFGFEAAVLKNMINVTADYFTDDRSDIFMSGGQRSVAAFFGTSAVAANLGKTHTQGYEIEVRLNKTFGKFNTYLNTAFTHAKDKILYYEDPLLYAPYQKTAGFQISQLKTQNAIPGYMNNWNDVYAATAPQSNRAFYQPGDMRMIDYNADGNISSSNLDNAPYGYPQRPQNTYNYTLGVDYKGFSLMFQFYGVNNVTRPQVFSAPFTDASFSTIYTKVSDQWTPQNLDASWKALRMTNSTNDGNLYIVDASYFRLKTAEIAYMFSNSPALKRLGVGSLRIFLNGQNLWVKTKMWDDREDNTIAGPDGNNNYPTIKRINLGVTINF